MCDDSAIYGDVRAPLTRFAAALVGVDDAPDLVSNVVVRTLARRSLCSLDDAQSYLMRAVLNEARAQARSRHRFSLALARVGPNPAEEIPASAEYSDLAEAVMALPLRQRAAVYLVYWVGMDSVEAGRALGCRPGTIRRYLSLARAKLERFTL